MECLGIAAPRKRISLMESNATNETAPQWSMCAGDRIEGGKVEVREDAARVVIEQGGGN
jgi:hypothetical protein